MQTTTEISNNTQSDPLFSLSDKAAARIELVAKREGCEPVLRISVMGGGCSGFQYKFDFESETPAEDDEIFKNSNAVVVIDETSLEIIKYSMLDYVETLGASAFEIRNPNAKSSCGCGNSFAV
jgi:iron-sulfur cluster insertion protein